MIPMAVPDPGEERSFIGHVDPAVLNPDLFYLGISFDHTHSLLKIPAPASSEEGESGLSPMVIAFLLAGATEMGNRVNAIFWQ